MRPAPRVRFRARQSLQLAAQIRIEPAHIDAVEARRLGHQLAKALHLSMSFQNVEVSEVPNGYSWEMGPQLGEPALN